MCGAEDLSVITLETMRYPKNCSGKKANQGNLDVYFGTGCT